MFPKEESMFRGYSEKHIKHISSSIRDIVSSRFGIKILLLPPVILLLSKPIIN